ncbi:MAG: hypothetical protein QOF20_2186, partial [Acidimicrobiaceae bacterium]|nr:hypothetical protein [Acidimicrobiaceae bacterium]
MTREGEGPNRSEALGPIRFAGLGSNLAVAAPMSRVAAEPRRHKVAGWPSHTVADSNPMAARCAGPAEGPTWKAGRDRVPPAAARPHPEGG